MGKEGMKEVNKLSCDGAHYLHNRLMATGKFREAFPGKPFLKEFTLSTDLDLAALDRYLADNGYMGGLDLGNGLVSFAVTEKRSKEEIDRLVELIENFAK